MIEQPAANGVQRPLIPGPGGPLQSPASPPGKAKF